MYTRYTESMGWKHHVLESNPTELGGFKDHLQRRGGGVSPPQVRERRASVQRVPRRKRAGGSTSAATVAILPEADEVEIKIDPGDLKFDVMRASGPGGQNVNKTDSAVRVRTFEQARRPMPGRNRSTRTRPAPSRSSRPSLTGRWKRSRRRLPPSAARRSLRRPEREDPTTSPGARTRFDPHKLDRILDGGLDDLVEALARASGRAASLRLTERRPGRRWRRNPRLDLLPLLEPTARFFREKGAEPSVDAELLMASLLGSAIDLYIQHDRPLSEAEVARFREMVRARSRGVPVQRIAGETEFYSIPLAVAGGVFIPRPETEVLVDRCVSFLRGIGGGEGRLALDAGTGTGAIAIAALRNVPALRMIAVDRSPKRSRARVRTQAGLVSDRIEIVEGDFVEALWKGGALVSSFRTALRRHRRWPPPVESPPTTRTALHGWEWARLYRR
jgi:hypothetical protein